ncbi:DUF397 domain-containing protein [Streptomyces sp. NPDC005492]|uniref:DUF397 domain-containing protein n=1 Tax=Streptomyces sp. NPDC005492 TaxID=3156883 RepID=UPI0033BCDF06
MTELITANATPLNGWRKSSYSGSEARSSLRVLGHHPAGVLTRDSKAQTCPTSLFS